MNNPYFQILLHIFLEFNECTFVAKFLCEQWEFDKKCKKFLSIYSNKVVTSIDMLHIDAWPPFPVIILC